MGQFKPMVKMFTDEPSVILKLKKGGKVASKAAGQSEGFKSMANNSGKIFEGAENGVAPKKPSMAERRKAMNPNQYAKGGKVAHKQMGGAMPMQGAPASAMPIVPANPTALGRAALTGMTPQQRMARAALVRRAMPAMKKGGSADKCAALEKELKHHEAMSASKAHGKASGGAIDKAATKTTIEGNAGKFAKTKMHDGDKTDKAHGTGGIKEKNAGGYAMGGTIKGNVGKFDKTKMVDGDKTDKAHGTGGIKEKNAGGFAKGGKVPGIGRAIEHDGDWENRPANGTPAGKVNGTTGGVRESNAGGFKKGGMAKKAYATGGDVVSDGKAEKMPRHFVSRPVANSLQSGTFKKGGQVAKFSKAGPVDAKDITDKASRELEEALNPLSMIKEGAGKVRDWFREKTAPEGSVTKTVKSTTVVPENKKRGGSAKC